MSSDGTSSDRTSSDGIRSTGTSAPGTRRMIDWAEHFAQAFTDLADGAADLHNLLDWAYDLYPSRGQEDPVKVARDEFRTASE
jgi:hypothetical protein